MGDIKNPTDEIKAILDELVTANEKASDLKTKALNFCAIKKKVDHFQELLQEYKRYFKEEFQNDICSKEIQLHAIKVHKKSPFRNDALKVWIEKINEELNILQSYEQLLSEKGVELLQSEVFNKTEKENAIVLNLTLYEAETKYRVNEQNKETVKDLITNYFKNQDDVSMDEDTIDSRNIDWYKDNEFRSKIITTINLIIEVAVANKSSEVLFFFLITPHSGELANVCLEVWMKGLKKNSAFEPPSNVKKLKLQNISNSSLKVSWEIPEKGFENVTSYLLSIKKVDFHKKTKPMNVEVNDNLTSYSFSFLDQDSTYEVSVVCTSMNKLLKSKIERQQIRINNSNNTTLYRFKVINYRDVLLLWSNPIDRTGKIIDKFDIKYRNKSADHWTMTTTDYCRSEKWFPKLNFSLLYHFQLTPHGYQSNIENIYLYTEKMPPLNLKKAFFKENEMIVEFINPMKEKLRYNFAYRFETELQNWIYYNTENILIKVNSNEFRIKINVEGAKDGIYLIKAKCSVSTSDETKAHEESEWSEVITCLKTNLFHHYDEEEKSYHSPADEINEENLKFVVDRPRLEIFETDSSLEAIDKEAAIKKWVKSIELTDHQCLMNSITWTDSTGCHTGVYHPMDLLCLYVKNIDFSGRRKLYRKLSICKLSVPVILPLEQPLFMDVSLGWISLSWNLRMKQFIEKNATEAELPVVTMLRLGNLKHISKSKLGNELIAKGEYGYFTRESQSNNNLRKVANGLVEALWFLKTKCSDSDKNRSTKKEFSHSFCLLNLRGDAFDHKLTATNLFSSSDVVVLVCDKSMFEKEWEIFLKDMYEKPNEFVFIIFYTDKKSQKKTSKNINSFNEWIRNVKFNPKKILHFIHENNIERLKVVIDESISTILKGSLPVRSLNSRFKGWYRKESNSNNINFLCTGFYNNILKKMNSISNSKEKRKQLLPFQSTVKEFSQLQRDLDRCESQDQKNDLEGKMNNIRNKRVEELNHIPKIIISFIENVISSEDKTVFLYSVQDVLNNWCKENILPVREAIAKKSSELFDLKGNKLYPLKIISKSCLEKELKRLKKKVINMTVGLENLFREIGEIYETFHFCDKRIENENHIKIFEKLPDMVALLLLKGFALELLDGDGLSVPITWIDGVLCALREPLKKYLGIDHEPKVFVLSVLGAQSSGKSTLLNAMFGLENPVSSGRTTVGAFMYLVPICIKNFPFDAFFVIDTEGLLAPEYHGINMHDNEIATLIFGISDLTIINNRNELITKENFLEISAFALMKMKMVDFHPRCIFVLQNCDDSAEDKNFENRVNILKALDATIEKYGKQLNKENITTFKDVVDISFEKDFFYFPQFKESSASMSPISSNYVLACAKLRNYILTEILASLKNSKTILQISDRIKLVWRGVLKENFVMNLLSAAYIQAHYEIDIELSLWKSEMDEHLSNFTGNLCKQISAMRNKQSSEVKAHAMFEEKSKQLNDESKIFFSKKENLFNKFIENKKVDIFKDLKQQSLNSMQMFNERCIQKCMMRIQKWFDCNKQSCHLIARFKAKIHKKARKFATRFLKNDDLDENANKNVSEEVCNEEFDKFWNSTSKTISNEFSKFPSYTKVDLSSEFRNGLFRNLTNKSLIESLDFYDEMFGSEFQNPYQLDLFVKSQPLFLNRSEDIKKLFESAQVELNDSLDFEKSDLAYEKLNIQEGDDFDCTTLVDKILNKANGILIQHNGSLSEPFEIRSELKAIFLYQAAHIAIEPFNKAQENFIQYIDIPNQIKKMKESVKEEFNMTLNKESNLVITAKRIARLLQRDVNDKVVYSAVPYVKATLLKKITLKEHLHGLVLLDILHIVSNKSSTTDKNKKLTLTDADKNYLEEYFCNPFWTFEKKIRDIIDNNYSSLVNYFEDQFKSKVKQIIITIEKLIGCKQAKKITLLYNDDYIKELAVEQVEFDDLINDETLDGKKKAEDENEILTKLIFFLTNAKLEVAKEFKSTLKNHVSMEVKELLISCQAKCPFCGAPCDSIHGSQKSHSCKYHRPEGFGGVVWKGFFYQNSFVIDICSDSIKCDASFENSDTKNKYIKYSDYKTVDDKSYSMGDKYTSWDIKGTTNIEDLLYWKYVTYQLMTRIENFFPDFIKVNIDKWSSISHKEAKNEVEKGFHIASLAKLVNDRYEIDLKL